MSRCWTDRLFRWSLRTSALLAGGVLLLIVGFLVLESIPALRSIGVSRFFEDPSWHPASGRYNLSPMLWGTLFATLGAIIVATPLALASALFCRFYAPSWIRRVYRGLIEVLAGIPSVVFGFWGLMSLVPLIQRLQPPGPSLLAGIAILALMILPTITLVADSSIEAIPKEQLRGAAALGLTRWATIRSVVLPSARSGLSTGILLGSGRAIGETMAVLMVCGNVVQTPDSLFDPIRTLTANIALEMAYATGDHRGALFLSGLLLTGLVLLLVAGAVSLGVKEQHVGR